MPNLTLPSDLQQRLAGFGDAIGACSDTIEFAYLFGSMVTGRLTPRSDVDLAIHVAPGADRHDIRLAVVCRSGEREAGGSDMGRSVNHSAYMLTILILVWR